MPRETCYYLHFTGEPISQVSPSGWAQRWSLRWPIHYSSMPKVTQLRSVKLRTPRLSILKPYHLHHAGHYFILEISPRARFFIYFLWAITGSMHQPQSVNTCQHLHSAFQKTCHFHMTLTPRAKIGQDLRAQAGFFPFLMISWGWGRVVGAVGLGSLNG